MVSSNERKVMSCPSFPKTISFVWHFIRFPENSQQYWPYYWYQMHARPRLIPPLERFVHAFTHCHCTPLKFSIAESMDRILCVCRKMTSWNVQYWIIKNKRKIMLMWCKVISLTIRFSFSFVKEPAAAIPHEIILVEISLCYFGCVALTRQSNDAASAQQQNVQ